MWRPNSQACNAAATKAMREADVIVCTSIGAADARLLAACGMSFDEEELMDMIEPMHFASPKKANALKLIKLRTVDD